MHALAALAAALVLPGFRLAAVGPDGGQLYAGRFPQTVRPGYVYLPPGFTTSARYPVVYLLHGLPGGPSEYVSGTSVVGFADGAISEGRLRPFIAVIPAAGATQRYDGEWAGRWARALVDGVVPWVDTYLPAIAEPQGRVIAGLSAGGFGAYDIALRHPGVFGAVESWSGYFAPLRDGPFKRASRATLAANDPALLVASEAPALRAAGVRFLVSTGPPHSHWIPKDATQAFAAELRRLGLDPALRTYASARGQWTEQIEAGLAWAFPQT